MPGCSVIPAILSDSQVVYQKCVQGPFHHIIQTPDFFPLLNSFAGYIDTRITNTVPGY